MFRQPNDGTRLTCQSERRNAFWRDGQVNYGREYRNKAACFRPFRERFDPDRRAPRPRRVRGGEGRGTDTRVSLRKAANSW